MEPTKQYPNFDFYNADNMAVMGQYPDGYFDICIVDPPYGIGIAERSFRGKHQKKRWDNAIPKHEYFTELFRVSKHQIIWGGNYFPLPPSQGFLIWDKIQPFDFSSAMCEFAWMSIQSPAKIFRLHVVTAEKNKMHPTQKPIALYEWLLKNYAKPNQRILDTHLGSNSIGIAIHKANELDKMNLSFVGCEIDKDYFDRSMRRFEWHRAQQIINF